VAKENRFHELFKTIKTARIPKFITHQAASSRLSGRHSRTPDSRTCWVDSSEAQWDGSGWLTRVSCVKSIYASLLHVCQWYDFFTADYAR